MGEGEQDNEVCDECHAVVADLEEHRHWHRALASRFWQQLEDALSSRVDSEGAR